MKILSQRGQSMFLVETDDSKHLIINTTKNSIHHITSADVFYKGGYCVEPTPDDDQKKFINDVLKMDKNPI